MSSFRLDHSLRCPDFQEYRLSRRLVESSSRMVALLSDEVDPQSYVSQRASLHNGLIAVPRQGESMSMEHAPSCFLLSGLGKLQEVKVQEDETEQPVCVRTLLEAPDCQTACETVALQDSSGSMAWVLRCVNQFLVCDADGCTRQFAKLPSDGADPGKLCAAARIDGGIRVAMCRRVQPPGEPRESFRVSFADFTFVRDQVVDAMDSFEPFLQLDGTFPVLAAVMSRERCMIVANAGFRENGRSDFPSELPSKGIGDDEVDDELRAMLFAKGFTGTAGAGMGGPVAVVTEVCFAKVAGASDDCCVQHMTLGHPAVAAISKDVAFPGTVELTLILRTPQGHGAIVDCEQTGSDGARLKHVDTFPGLGLIGEAPGFAYMRFSPSWRIAALARWRGGAAVELFSHPRGATSADTQAVSLPPGCALRGLHVSDDEVIVWHTSGIDRYKLAESSCSSSQAADWGSREQHQGNGGVAMDWADPPAITVGDWGEGPPEAADAGGVWLHEEE